MQSQNNHTNPNNMNRQIKIQILTPYKQHHVIKTNFKHISYFFCQKQQDTLKKQWEGQNKPNEHGSFICVKKGLECQQVGRHCYEVKC
jgi:hypothetical protein